MVAGYSSLDVQQRVVDAGFHNVVVTPIGGDKMFLHCSSKVDMLSTSLVCYSLICINGHQKMHGMNREHGSVCMVLLFMHGMNCFSYYVFRSMEDSFGPMIVRGQSEA